MSNVQQPLKIEEESITFIRSRGELSKLLRRVDKTTIGAIELLESIMNDTEVDLKLRRSCAKDLIDINIETAKVVNNDNLQRMIAQLKLNPGKGTKTLVDSDSVPEIDFETVSEL